MQLKPLPIILIRIENQNLLQELILHMQYLNLIVIRLKDIHVIINPWLKLLYLSYFH